MGNCGLFFHPFHPKGVVGPPFSYLVHLVHLVGVSEVLSSLNTVWVEGQGRAIILEGNEPRKEIGVGGFEGNPSYPPPKLPPPQE